MKTKQLLLTISEVERLLSIFDEHVGGQNSYDRELWLKLHNLREALLIPSPAAPGTSPTT